ncbi:MAG: exodeoxyribonuclease V subunit gamma [Spiribacter sp.]|nr:exodeoxyribonuclease V subunit gamma [Spiribacter sp.]
MPAQLGSLNPGLMILQGNRLEDLRDLLTEWIKTEPLQPLEDETILVQSNGIAQWLKMAVANDHDGCGIAAALAVHLPGRFVWQAYRSVFPDLPELSPFDKAPLTWRIYRLLSDWPALEARVSALGDSPSALHPLRGFLSQDQDPRRLYQLAGHLADLLDQYQVYRADWLAHWADGRFANLAPDDQWQALLWRALVADLAADDQNAAQASRATVHQAVIERCATFSPEKRPASLPRRVVVFGISSLPRQTLELLQALSPFTQILVFAGNPCQHYWGDLVEGKHLLAHEYQRIAQRKLPQNLTPEDLHLYGHPLLASWGKQGRDYLHLLDEQDQPERYRDQVMQTIQSNIDLYRDPREQRDCLLTQVQADIFNLRSLADRQAHASPIDPAQDRSMEFIIAHSPQREVEILHDQLLAAFEQAKANGQDLAAREVLVMVPDIHVYAPHIEAVFGRYAAPSEAPDPRYLPYHIADQGHRAQNTLLIALEKLLALPTSRFAVSELLDLLDTPALRARYQIDEADLPRLREWINGANIRWGLDGEQRADLGLPNIEQNTWLFGMRRLLLGFASGTSPAWQGIEPHDQVTGLEAALLGPLAALLDDLKTTRATLTQAHSPSDWSAYIKALVARFFTATSKADRWAITTIDIQLEQLETVWHCGGLTDQALPLDVVRDELLTALDQPTLTQKFLGGSINFGTLLPMRAIPFEQVWLLGMNDADYPRHRRPADFDLMAKDYRPGDRSRREDDRYLFLEALLSARQKLVISWVGRDIRDNTPRPPSVLVGQLRDHLTAGWQHAQPRNDSDKSPGHQLLQALTTEHPLQPFSREYFARDRDPRLFTYAHEWRALHTPVPISPPAYPAWQPESTLDTHALAGFLRHPVKTFYTQRLGVHWHDPRQILPDEEPFTLDGLTAWQLTDQLIQTMTQRLSAQPDADVATLLDPVTAQLERRGDLPAPPFAQRQRHALEQSLSAPLHTYAQLLHQYPTLLSPERVELSVDDVVLDDAVTDLRANAAGERLRVVVQPSRLYQGSGGFKWAQLIYQWPAHCLAQCTAPTPTRIIGPDSDLTLAPIEAEQAKTYLVEQMQAWRQGLTELLPLPCKTAFASLEPGGNPREVYEGGYQRSGEIHDHPGFARGWPTFAALASDPRFATLTEQLYSPLAHYLDAPVARGGEYD